MTAKYTVLDEQYGSAKERKSQFLHNYSRTPFERPPPLERPLDNKNVNINVLISTSDERPPLLKGHSGAKGFNCTTKTLVASPLRL